MPSWTTLNRGDVVLVDLGMRAKVRPCMVVSIPKADSRRNMSVVVPFSTEIRKGETEVSFAKPAWLRQDSVIQLIGIAGVDNAKIERRLGTLPASVLQAVDAGLVRLLGL